MSKDKDGTSCKEAIKRWQDANPDTPAHEAIKVTMMCQVPPMKKMDNKLNDLVACEYGVFCLINLHLSLSTNAIDKIQPLPGLKNLKILSVGRNNLKSISKLDDNAGTLEELWASYNSIEKLDGLQYLRKLRVLYLGNNQLKSFDELLKIKDLPALQELLLVGNPFYGELSVEDRRVEVIKRLPKLAKLDAVMVTEGEREAATSDI